MLIRLNVSAPTEDDPRASYNLYKVISYEPLPRIGEEVEIDEQLMTVKRVIHTPLPHQTYGRPQATLFFSIETQNLEYLRTIEGWRDLNQEEVDSLS